MQLTALQQDALVELLNIGFGRTGAALSQLTGHRVILDVPEVTVHEIADLSDALRRVIADEVASVHQVFTGPVAGDALLVLDHQGAAQLKELLTEVGNILLNACLGTFGNILKVQVSFSVPRLNLESLSAIVESLRINQEGPRYALVVHAGFRLRDREVKGYLVIVLSVSSLDRLVRAVENWEQSH
jgi:chemotaxis protein CheC